MQDKHAYLFAAESEGEMEEWVATLQRVLRANEAAQAAQDRIMRGARRGCAWGAVGGGGAHLLVTGVRTRVVSQTGESCQCDLSQVVNLPNAHSFCVGKESNQKRDLSCVTAWFFGCAVQRLFLVLQDRQPSQTQSVLARISATPWSTA